MLETNVISELKKTRSHESVVRFTRDIPPHRLCVSVLSLGELRKGAAMRAKKSLASAQPITDWVDELEKIYGDRVLTVDLHIARLWGELCADRTRPAVDTLLAATAIRHGLTLVTRNTRDVRDLPVALSDPWLHAMR